MEKLTHGCFVMDISHKALTAGFLAVSQAISLLDARRSVQAAAAVAAATAEGWGSFLFLWSHFVLAKC